MRPVYIYPISDQLSNIIGFVKSPLLFSRSGLLRRLLSVYLPSLIKAGIHSPCDSLMARLLLLAGLFLGLVCCTEAYDFYVGVRSGWVVKPAESYNSWAERMRFQVKDKLIFNYKKGEDSVLVVSKKDYDSCNIKNPIQKFEDGKSVFIFDRSGPFFFISGADGHCAQGQKLIVVVMAVRNKPVQPPPASSPPASSPPPPPPSASTPSPSPVPDTKPPSSSPPSTSPSPAPAITPPSSSPSPAPVTKPPSSSPSPAPAAKSPSSSPSPSPTTKPPSSSPSPSPSSSSSPSTSPAKSPLPAPSSIPPATPPAGPGASGGGSSGGGAAPPAPTPSSNSTSTPTPSSAQITTVSTLSHAIFTLFLGAAVLF